MDSILLSTMASRLRFISKEMAVIMGQTARSSIFSDARDFVCSIFDSKLRLVAQEEYLPILLFATPFGVRSAVKFFGDDIHPGDVLVHNDVFDGGNQLPDWTVMRPVFYRGGLVGWLANKAHQADTGGGIPGGYNPNATDVFQEGFVIPPIKIYQRGEERRDVINLLMKNVRFPRVQRGDISAMVGSTRVGEKRIIEVIERFGEKTYFEAIDQLLVHGEERMTKELGKIPRGTYEGEAVADPSLGRIPHPVLVKAKITIGKGHMQVDYTGSEKQVTSYINSPLANTHSCTYTAVFTVIDPTIPHNEGALKPIVVNAPEGSVLNPRWPAPSTFCTHVLASQIVHSCWIALSRALPDRVSAPWARSSGAKSSGTDPRDGDLYNCHHFQLWGGGGAFPGRDGDPAVGVAGTAGAHICSSIEMNEVAYPVYTIEYELLQDSCGAGRWRGGMGVKYSFKAYPPHETLFARTADGEETPTVGLLGAPEIVRNRGWIVRADGERVPVKGGVYRLGRDEAYYGETQGGAGIGNPLDRPKEMVMSDLRDGYISRESARDVYGLREEIKNAIQRRH